MPNKPVVRPRRIQKNWALRQELINKGFVIPRHLLPAYFRKRGFLAAAEAIEKGGRR